MGVFYQTNKVGLENLLETLSYVIGQVIVEGRVFRCMLEVGDIYQIKPENNQFISNMSCTNTFRHYTPNLNRNSS